jgi:PAS domain S-box-containing protein
VSALCQYHRRRFPTKVIKDMVHIHPIVASGNEMWHNPAFMDHDEFIHSHDEMEVQKLLDAVALASRLQRRNQELEKALLEKSLATTEVEHSKRLQKELEESLEKERRTRLYAEAIKSELEEFVNNATEGLHWVAADGTILWANRAELDLLGYTEKEYLGRNIRDFHADAHVIADILRRLQNKETLRNYAARLRAKDGSIKSVLISSNVLWRDGKFVHTQCFTRDITDLQLAEERAAQAEQIKELNEELHSLAQVVSHELQEPIAKIRSYLSLLSVRYRGQLGKDADEFIDICTQSAKVVHRMIDDLWLFARITKIDENEVSAVSAGALVAGVLHEYEERIRSLNAKVNVGPLPRVHYSEKQLAYIFESLLNNALTYRRDGMAPEISINAELCDGEWVISVADNGKGIDPIYFRDVFRAFFRLDARPGAGGTGMGLAICQKIIHSRGGRIWVQSTPGQGSTFYFTLPVNAEA